MSESKTNVANLAIPPEEEELFKEFQAYVRSIYTAASDGAIQSLNEATAELRQQVTQLDETVTQSREGYREMFLPAVERFEASAGEALARLASKQEEAARHHWERTSELVKQQAQEHRQQLQHQSTHFEESLKKRIQQMTFIILGVMLFLAFAVPGVLYMAFRPK